MHPVWERGGMYVEINLDDRLRTEVIEAGGPPALVLEQGALTVHLSSHGEDDADPAAVDATPALVAAEALYTAAVAYRDAVRAHHETRAATAGCRPVKLEHADGDLTRAEVALALILAVLRSAGGGLALPVSEFEAAVRDVRSGVVWGLITDPLDDTTLGIYLNDAHRVNGEPRHRSPAGTAEGNERD
ncbi:hypothetical protein BAY59_38640 (plasmid) [Prauserella coralliicola]|nr:hypothetical protein BAY59_38640 [Prauserella coralliicola]